MNNDQRKYLIQQVQSTADEKIEALRQSEPTQPSLNNHLISCFLDNTIQFADLSKLKDKIREKVIKLGHGDALIDEEDDDRYFSSRKKKRNKEMQQYIKLIAEDLFVIPESYIKAEKEYQRQIEKMFIENSID